MSEVRAVVDCGSNSTRLWLRPDPSAVPERRERVTRLGQGVDATGELDPVALERTLDAIEDHARRWREAGVTSEEVVVIATSAVRDAGNRDRYVDGVRELAGVTPVVLTGEQEAAASFIGATAGLAATDDQVLVVDIGGGSTELVTGDPGTTDGLRARSMQLGTVRLTERCLPDDPPSADQVRDARDTACDILERGLDAIGLATDRPVHVVAVAGTATTLASLDVGAGEDPAFDDIDGHVITAPRLADLAAALARRSSDQRLEIGPMNPGRADVIAAGALILDELASLVGRPDVTVSGRDVMDGVARLWPFD